MRRTPSYPFRFEAMIFCAAGAALSLWLAEDAFGCSPVMGYVQPTNYELVKEADAIVVAQAIAFKSDKTYQGHHYGTFEFKVIEKLKGDCNAASLLVEGDDNIRSWGDPGDFSFSKGDHGPCNATDYKLKANYVLFLEKWKGKWIVSGPPFTRINVIVDGTNAPWVQAVRQYSLVASLDNYEQEKAGLRDVQARANAKDRGYPVGLVKDIEQHFLKPTPAKSFNDLKSLYERTDDPETRELVLWACARGKKAEAKEFFGQLVKSGAWEEYLEYLYPVCSYISQVGLPGFHKPIAAALANNTIENERRMLLFALSGTAGPEQQSFMQGVLESLDKEEAAILSEWFVKHPSQEAIKHLTRLASKDYAEGTDLTFALAAMGDTNVVDWAEGFAKKPSERDWVSYYVYAQSPLAKADALARKVIKAGDSEDLVSLVQGYRDSQRNDRLDRLKEIVALKEKGQKLTYWLRRTLGDMAYEGDKQAEFVLKQLPVVDSEE